MVKDNGDLVACSDGNSECFTADTGALDMSALHERFLRHVLAGSSVLNADCGAGSNALALIEHSSLTVTFDALAEMVRLVRDRVGRQAKI